MAKVDKESAELLHPLHFPLRAIKQKEKKYHV